jgi:hypothetical protein
MECRHFWVCEQGPKAVIGVLVVEAEAMASPCTISGEGMWLGSWSNVGQARPMELDQDLDASDSS